jgi:D-aminoacyl-tRNA deacylase
MIAIVQRVTEARVEVDGQTVGAINHGLLVLAAIERRDSPNDVEWMANKLVGLRLFRSGEKHFDLDVKQVSGSILLVSNFTVSAQTNSGRRPSLDGAADPARARELFDALVQIVSGLGVPTATGQFGGDMRVHSVNEGPATFIVESPGRPV